MATKKRIGGKVAMGAGALAAAAAVAAAGYYFYASKDAKKHRKIAATWAGGLKKDVVKQAKKVKAMGKEDIMKAVDAATSAYKSARSIDTKELARAAKELKNNWREIVMEAGTAGMKMASKKTAKKTTKKKTAKRSK